MLTQVFCLREALTRRQGKGVGRSMTGKRKEKGLDVAGQGGREGDLLCSRSQVLWDIVGQFRSFL